MDESTITARVHGRTTARQLIELAEPDGLIPEARQAFWEALRAEALKHAPLPEPPKPKRLEPMTDAQAKAFETTSMPWGKYEGNSVGYVFENDPEYLDFILEPDQFKLSLARYLLAMNRVPDLDDESVPY